MHFLLLGATGRTGKHVISELLTQKHTATALVRNPDSLETHTGLTIVRGSPLSKADIRKAIIAVPDILPSAVIFTLNTTRKSDSPFATQIGPPRFLADSCANACETSAQFGIYRIVVMSTAGVGDSWNNLPLLSRAFMGLTNIKYALEDHNLLDREIRKTDMEWTLVRPVKLQHSDDKAVEIDILEGSGIGMKMSDNVTPASVAKFLVKAAIEGLYIKEEVVVRN
ncbi:hypothetical protein ACLX1H_007946 [Fusarium chlamydosporum]